MRVRVGVGPRARARARARVGLVLGVGSANLSRAGPHLALGITMSSHCLPSLTARAKSMIERSSLKMLSVRQKRHTAALSIASSGGLCAPLRPPPGLPTPPGACRRCSRARNRLWILSASRSPRQPNSVISGPSRAKPDWLGRTETKPALAERPGVDLG